MSTSPSSPGSSSSSSLRDLAYQGDSAKEEPYNPRPVAGTHDSAPSPASAGCSDAASASSIRSSTLHALASSISQLLCVAPAHTTALPQRRGEGARNLRGAQEDTHHAACMCHAHLLSISHVVRRTSPRGMGKASDRGHPVGAAAAALLLRACPLHAN